MTEESYQECRKLMQKINHLRGLITAAKGEVAKWSNIESSFREKMQHSRADGAKKILDTALLKLKERRDKFTAMKFPDSNINNKICRCKDCGVVVKQGDDYCGLGYCINDL